MLIVTELLELSDNYILYLTDEIANESAWICIAVQIKSLGQVCLLSDNQDEVMFSYSLFASEALTYEVETP